MRESPQRQKNRERLGSRGHVPVEVRVAAETEEQREARLQRDRDVGNNSHSSHCLSNHLCKQRCVNSIHSLVHWMYQHVPPVLKDFLASNFIQILLSVSPAVRISTHQRCSHQTII